MTIIESTAEDGVITLGDLLALVMIFALLAWAQKQTTRLMFKTSDFVKGRGAPRPYRQHVFTQSVQEPTTTNEDR